MNEVVGSYKEVEKMVRQIIRSDENISEEGKGVLKEYFVSARGLNKMFREKMAEPVLVGNRPTKVIRDNKTKIQKINSFIHWYWDMFYWWWKFWKREEKKK